MSDQHPKNWAAVEDAALAWERWNPELVSDPKADAIRSAWMGGYLAHRTETATLPCPDTTEPGQPTEVRATQREKAVLEGKRAALVCLRRQIMALPQPEGPIRAVDAYNTALGDVLTLLDEASA